MVEKVEKKENNKLAYILIVIFLLLIIWNYYREVHDNSELKFSKKTKAVLIQIKNGKSVRSTPSGTYEYIVNGKKYQCEENTSFYGLYIGDTILIEYSINDPSIAIVIDKHY